MKITQKIIPIIALLAISACSPKEEHTVHIWQSGVCTICGLECEHDYSNGNGKCSICNMSCKHLKSHSTDNICDECGLYSYHNFHDGECTLCHQETNLENSVPEEFKSSVTNKGQVVDFTYHTKNYTYCAAYGTDLVDVTKKAAIYLPHDYSEDKKYNVIYLLPGQLESYDYWFRDQSVYTTNVFDHLLEANMAEDFIAVSYNFHTMIEDYDDPSKVDAEKVKFEADADMRFVTTEGGVNEIKDYEGVCDREIKDLIKQVETNYSTYLENDDSDANLTATRAHRAMGGFSVGSHVSWQSGFCKSYSYIGNFVCMEGSNLTYLPYIEKAIELQTEENLQVHFIFQQSSEKSDAEATQREFFQEIVENNNYFEYGKNCLRLEVKGGNHWYQSYMDGLFNAMCFIFSDNPETVNVPQMLKK
ncbi:MAG: hypothetical protein IJ186_00685 [Bacilli bacterium]|nr:hypothetical protein [Bacilli bacterium]